MKAFFSPMYRLLMDQDAPAALGSFDLLSMSSALIVAVTNG
jgi:hypothetical protein